MLSPLKLFYKYIIFSFLIMSSESFPSKEKRIRIHFPFCRRCVIMHGYRVQCASARRFGRIHPHQIIQYPGIAKLVSRLVWDQETVRSSRTTRTKIPLKSLISEGFSYSLSIAAQILRLSLSTYLFDKCRLNIVIFAEVQYNIIKSF